MKRFACILLISAFVACSPSSEDPETTAVSTPSLSEVDAGTVVLTVPGLAPYIGAWEGEDGQLRQVFEIADNGAVVQACMLAPDTDGMWQVVSAGRYLAEGEEIRGQFTGEAMGFESLSAVGYPVGGDGGVDWVNTATTVEGVETTYETWAAPAGGVFTYVIERGEGAQRELWFAGQWRFRGDLQISCSGQ